MLTFLCFQDFGLGFIPGGGPEPHQNLYRKQCRFKKNNAGSALQQPRRFDLMVKMLTLFHLVTF
jgi:hypothetical protein